MRFALASLPVLLLVLGARLAAAAEPPPVVVYHAAEGADDVRVALDGVARRNGTVLIDVSPPAPSPPKASRHLARGIDAFNDLKWDTAMAQLDDGLAEAANTGAAGLSTSELSDLLLYRALVLNEQGDSTRSWEDMVRAAVIDPTRKLDPVRFPPRVSESFQRAVDSVTAGKQTRLSIAAPEGCAIAVDGRTLSGVDAVDVPFGEHYVRVECTGASPFGARIAASEAEQTVKAEPVARAPMTAKDAAALALRRGAVTFILAVVTRSPEAAPTVALRLYDTATVSEKGAVIVAADGNVGAAAQSLIDTVVTPPKPIIEYLPPPPTPWYKEPWVWGVAGAVVTTAILIPFLIDDAPADTFDAVPEVQ